MSNIKQSSESIKSDYFSGALKGNAYLLPAYLIALSNVLFFGNRIVSMAIVVVEVCVLFYFLFRLDIARFLSWFVVFLSTCIEFSALTSNENAIIWGFKNVRILGLNLGLLFVILGAFVLFAIGAIQKPNIKRMREPYLHKVMLIFSCLGLVGIITGLLNIMGNDNGIRSYPGMAKSFVEQIYMGIWPFLLFYIAYFVIRKEIAWHDSLRDALVATLIANALAPILPAVMGISGSYGSFKYMLASSANFFAPFLAIFPAYKEYKSKRLLFWGVFAVGSILPMMLWSYVNGKILIIVLFLPVIYLGVVTKQRKKRKKTLIAVFFIVLLVIFIIQIFPLEEGSLLDSKVKEATSLIGLFQSDWELILKPSARYRIYEIINLIEEYKQNPIQIVLGKGFMGSIKDHIGKFGWKEPGSFPDQQFETNAFFSLHEISSYFLKFGLLGAVVFVYLGRIIWKKRKDNPWIILGCYWFFLLYGFSLTISCIGAVSLALGLAIKKPDQKTQSV